jgi:hypothetical protein
MLLGSVGIAFTAFAADTPVYDAYSKKGTHKVSTLTFTVDENDFTYKVWYPSDIASLKKRPLILYCNGTGSNYEQESAADTVKCHELAASRGYIVVNNTDQNCGTGASMDAGFNKLKLINEDPGHILFGKIDMGKVLLAGHSQGATCTVNMANPEKYENAKYYKAIFAASLPNPELAAGPAQNCPYDTTKVSTPILFIAGIHWQETAISPLNSLQENFKNVKGDAYLSRINGIPHTESYETAFPYMMAWFDYRLYGNKTAAKVFTGKKPELDSAKWRDFDVKITKKGFDVSGVKALRKSFKVSWKKNNLVSGYQVEYATNKSFTKGKKRISTAYTSKMVKNLKARKRYYIRVRTYTVVGDKKFYSKWSSVKSVKTKK